MHMTQSACGRRTIAAVYSKPRSKAPRVSEEVEGQPSATFGHADLLRQLSHHHGADDVDGLVRRYEPPAASCPGRKGLHRTGAERAFP